MIRTEQIQVNMGPQHPATHGVLRLVLTINNEIITEAVVHLGYLHRGIEKLAESKTYMQFLPVTDRLDYVSSMFNNFAYVLAVEKLLGIEAPPKANYIRVILAELNRIASHLIWLGTQALDLGAWTPLLYTFRERERILDIFELYCGARMTFSCFRIGGVFADIPSDFIKYTKKFLDEFPRKLTESEKLLTKNKIWLGRCVGVGIISKEEAIEWGLSGPVLRGSGINFDIRKVQPYGVYNEFEWDVAVQGAGDVYARYLVRVQEMRESCKIVKQAIDNIPEGPTLSPDAPKLHKVLNLPAGEAYVPVESPRGELGFYIVSDGKDKPYRLKIRSPAFSNIQILPKLLKGCMVADAVAIIASLDPVLGEIDR